MLERLQKYVLPHDPITRPIGPDERLPQAVVWHLRFVGGMGCELFQVKPEPNGRWAGLFEEEYVRAVTAVPS